MGRPEIATVVGVILLAVFGIGILWGRAVRRRKIFCATCGAEVVGRPGFCGGCGTELNVRRG